MTSMVDHIKDLYTCSPLISQSAGAAEAPVPYSIYLLSGTLLWLFTELDRGDILEPLFRKVFIVVVERKK